MAIIPDSQLATWAQIPSSTERDRMKTTYDVIKEALEKAMSVDILRTKYQLGSYKYEVYTQGSYTNSTYIKFNSDIDVVVQFNSSWFGDISDLPQDQQTYYRQAHVDSALKFLNFKQDVFTALQTYFDCETRRCC